MLCLWKKKVSKHILYLKSAELLSKENCLSRNNLLTRWVEKINVLLLMIKSLIELNQRHWNEGNMLSSLAVKAPSTKALFISSENGCSRSLLADLAPHPSALPFFKALLANTLPKHWSFILSKDWSSGLPHEPVPCLLSCKIVVSLGKMQMSHTKREEEAESCRSLRTRTPSQKVWDGIWCSIKATGDLILILLQLELAFTAEFVLQRENAKHLYAYWGGGVSGVVRSEEGSRYRTGWESPCRHLDTRHVAWLCQRCVWLSARTAAKSLASRVILLKSRATYFSGEKKIKKLFFWSLQ